MQRRASAVIAHHSEAPPARLLETATFQKLIGGVKRALCMSALFVCLAALLESLFDRREAHDRLVFKSDVLYR
jgi:hypothetical protein